ncbi:MAG: hypothetical protein M3N29_09525 [Chloroflexota bacterium]|nr:hypothetical protein [Chloroflexota bacterium]
MRNDPFERELRETLAARAPAGVPASLHAQVATLEPDAKEGWFSRVVGRRPRRLDWLGLVARSAVAAVAVLLVFAIGGLGLLYATLPPGIAGPGAGAKAIVWRTDLAALEADAISIETAGQLFTAAANDFDVSSDRGSDAYRTLEISWREHRREMRLNLYFAADDASWWVTELRVYDGRPRGDWITFRGPLSRTERGRSFVGDVDLSGHNEHGSARLRIEGARLTAFVPGTGPRPFENCRFVGPPGRDLLGRPVPQQLDPDLSEFGLFPGMDARDAYDQIVRHAICYEFRLEFPALNRDQRWCLPPPGKVREFLFGSEGQLLVFVEDPTRTTDANMPDFVGCH